jgi:hypothetical protein
MTCLLPFVGMPSLRAKRFDAARHSIEHFLPSSPGVRLDGWGG